MLSVINHSNMAMNLPPCCQYAPYCPHQHRQLQPQSLPSLGLGLTGEGASWSNRIPPHHQAQYGFNRPQQAPLFPSQTLSFLNDHDKFRSASNSYATPSHPTSWSTPTFPMIGGDFANATWLPNRNKDNLQGAASSSFSHEGSDYIAGVKYESLELQDVSPSPAAEFSTVSASSQPSPAPAANYITYGGMRAPKGESPFLSTQPLQPEHLRAAESQARRMSSASFDPESPSRHSKSRPRKGSEGMQCQLCFKSFDRRSNFKSHWETHDKDRQRTVCKIDGCEKTFGRPAEMTRHVNSAHRQKSFPCASCGKEFTRHDILLRHCKDACPVLVKGKGNGKKRRNKAPMMG